jgi:hypothetical protein
MYRKNNGAYFRNATVHLLLHNNIQTHYKLNILFRADFFVYFFGGL